MNLANYSWIPDKDWSLMRIPIAEKSLFIPRDLHQFEAEFSLNSRIEGIELNTKLISKQRESH